MIGDHELLEFRRGYYGLLQSLLAQEPSAELLRRLADGAGGRIEAARALHPALGEGWEAIAAYFGRRPRPRATEDAAEEFTRLFIGPLQVPVQPYESYYLTGRVYDRPLAIVRRFLQEIGVEKAPGYAEPEDSLAVELSVMTRLTGRQAQATDPDDEAPWLGHQDAFLKRHLLVWAPACARDIELAAGDGLYGGVGRLLRGFLDLEAGLFMEWGAERVRSLEAARAEAAGTQAWRGPLFEPAPTPEAGREEGRGRPGDPAAGASSP